MASHAHLDGCARLNVMRLNAARLNYAEPIIFASVGGVDRGRNLRIEGAAITHVLNDAPDTAAFRMHGFVPLAGQTIQVYAGDRDANHQLFGGRILEATTLYESRKQNVAYDCNAIDPTWLLNRRRVLARYVGVGANDIIGAIMSGFTYGFEYWTHVNVGNPVIPEITFTNETVAACLTAICERIGAYWYIDYANSLHVFFSETVNANPITDAQPRGTRDHTLTEDLSQVVTRVIGRGAGVGAASDLLAASVQLPLDLGDAANLYNPAGGLVEVNSERVMYAGVRGLGGVGALVGVGNAPTAAPTVTPAGHAGPALTSGATYQYAVSYVTANGETLPGPLASYVPSATTGHQTAVRPLRSRYPGSAQVGAMTPNQIYYWGIQIQYEGGVLSPVSPLCGPYVVDMWDWECNIGTVSTHPVTGYRYWPLLEANPPAPHAYVRMFRTKANQTTLLDAHTGDGMSGNAPGWIGNCGTVFDDSLGPPPGAAGTMNAAIVIVPYGGTQTTKTRIYRTVANGSQLKLAAEITTPTTQDRITDIKTDAQLGANAPTTDTSGLSDAKQVSAGSTVLPVSSTLAFSNDGGATGGWMRVGNLVVWYTGIAVGELTGIPSTGIGSLTTSVRYGTQILVQPRLVGIPATGPGAITRAIKRGDTVTIRYELNDAIAQNAMAARLDGDGVIEEVFSDSRMQLAELADYCRALLTDRKDPIKTLRFTTRDRSCEVGRLITITMTTPPISGTFRIQRIGFSEIAITGGLGRVGPLLAVEASTKLYTFADLLRRLRGREGGAG